MNEFYPIGSLVMIQNVPTPIMVMGYLPSVNERLYDYVGVPYPTGFVSPKSTVTFDHKLIEKCVAEGYADEDCKTILKAIPTYVSGIVANKAAKEGE